MTLASANRVTATKLTPAASAALVYAESVLSSAASN
jgi:hypothetical protein